MPKNTAGRFSLSASIREFLLVHSLLTRLSVTFKIETVPEKNGTGIRLIGWLRSEYLAELRAKIGRSGRPVVLELAEVTLVDVEAVRFLSACEAQGIELRHCPPYIRKWIAREDGRKV
jgi:hypothetical protein